MEHAYSTKRRQMHNWYSLLQIFQMILQLVEHGSLLRPTAATIRGARLGTPGKLARKTRIRHNGLNILVVFNTVTAQLGVR